MEVYVSVNKATAALTAAAAACPGKSLTVAATSHLKSVDNSYRSILLCPASLI
jgi:hypothetical protein